MTLVTIYTLLFMVCTIYAMVLAWIQKHPRLSYSPDWTWLTVVIGNAIIMVAIGFLFIHGYESVWSVGMCFVVAGVPVITWQLWETYQRRRELAAHRGKNNG